MTTQAKIPLTDLLERYEAALSEMGYSITTKLLFVKRAELIIRRHLDQGIEYLVPEIVNNYEREIDARYFHGNLKKRHYDRIRREIERFIAYADSGSGAALPSPLLGVRQKISPTYQQLAEEFISGDFHPNTRCDIRWVTYKYFAWLEQQGYSSMADVGAVQIQKFLLYSSERFAPSSVHNIQLYLKKLYVFLHRTGKAASDYADLFSFTVSREKRVFPSLPKSDMAKLLDAIDRTTVKGKRDYAIMLLGIVLGLRACDVAKLKLADVDWMRGEISVLQSKTSNRVLLPLTQDVGEALKDYILHARPKSRAEEVFLRIKAPHTPFAAATAVGDIYEDCCIAAGLPVSKRFHNLRRTLGTSMVSNGVSVYDVAQVFGDRSINSTKPYLATDTEHLKMCALSFHGIAPSGGEV